MVVEFQVSLDLEETGWDDTVVIVQKQVAKHKEDEHSSALGPVNVRVIKGHIGFFLDSLKTLSPSNEGVV